jgi:hypothetical protein
LEENTMRIRIFILTSLFIGLLLSGVVATAKWSASTKSEIRNTLSEQPDPGTAVVACTVGISSNGVTPTYVAGNPTLCSPGRRVDPPVSGTYTSGPLVVTVTISADGKFVSWTSNIPIASVVVKGGPGANVYNYLPSGSTGDGCLHSPINASGEPAGISHIDFCYIPCPPPVITCPSDVTVECDQSTDPSSTGTATATAQCGPVEITYKDTETAGACPQEKIISRLWTAKDAAGNSVSCTQKITVEDTKVPTLAGCPTDLTIECDQPIPAAANVTATDNCDANVPVIFKETVQNGDCPQEKVITRTWTATDDCGNSASCTQKITVEDTKAPTLAGCPTDLTIECDQPIPAPAKVTATDACDTDVSVDFKQTEEAGKCPQEKVITRTWTAMDDCGNSASCTQKITVVDTKPPTITCPTKAIEACAETINGAYVNYTKPTATDNCDTAPVVSCDPPSGRLFPIGTTTVKCTASDACGNSAECTFEVEVKGGDVCGTKFFDANADGDPDTGEVGVSGIQIKLTGTDSGGNPVNMTVYTDQWGNYCFQNVPLGEYTVSEVLPNGWIATTPTSYKVKLENCNDITVNPFGNLCLGAGGGRTPGFWSNKNGENQMNDGGTAVPELNLLGGLCLRKADGSDFDPGTYGDFRTWILGATATNMAYMLSAQLAAMQLNVEAGFVSGSSLVYAPGCGNTGVGNNFISITDLMAAANTALCADGYTPSGDPNRATQECLKNALDNANNNRNFVQTKPCSNR